MAVGWVAPGTHGAVKEGIARKAEARFEIPQTMTWLRWRALLRGR